MVIYKEYDNTGNEITEEGNLHLLLHTIGAVIILFLLVCYIGFII